MARTKGTQDGKLNTQGYSFRRLYRITFKVPSRYFAAWSFVRLSSPPGRAAAQQQLPKQADFATSSKACNSWKQQNWQAAASEFREVIKINPQRAQAQHMLGQALEKLGEREASLAAFRRSIGIDPSNAEAHYNLGTALGEFGNLQEAVAELGQAVTLKADFEAAHLALASFGSRGENSIGPLMNTRQY